MQPDRFNWRIAAADKYRRKFSEWRVTWPAPEPLPTDLTEPELEGGATVRKSMQDLQTLKGKVNGATVSFRLEVNVGGFDRPAQELMGPTSDLGMGVKANVNPG
ncbi:hypothetical protein NDU88_001411 [Pleurodeles waltl]|uniref:Uncharacterized protein n=1 Tax=Pleurodeles waltl TaxID=8319 RepID=A0AAV7M592_PLEWA|nr:hypothetical protein NDU88_001411 [Pleurodeles waltl]